MKLPSSFHLEVLGPSVPALRFSVCPRSFVLRPPALLTPAAGSLPVTGPNMCFLVEKGLVGKGGAHRASQGQLLALISASPALCRGPPVKTRGPVGFQPGC